MLGRYSTYLTSRKWARRRCPQRFGRRTFKLANPQVGVKSIAEKLLEDHADRDFVFMCCVVCNAPSIATRLAPFRLIVYSCLVEEPEEACSAALKKKNPKKLVAQDKLTSAPPPKPTPHVHGSSFCSLATVRGNQTRGHPKPTARQPLIASSLASPCVRHLPTCTSQSHAMRVLTV